MYKCSVWTARLFVNTYAAAAATRLSARFIPFKVYDTCWMREGALV